MLCGCTEGAVVGVPEAPSPTSGGDPSMAGSSSWTPSAAFSVQSFWQYARTCSCPRWRSPGAKGKYGEVLVGTTTRHNIAVACWLLFCAAMGLRAGGVLHVPGRAAGLRFRVVGCAKCLGWLTRTKKVEAVEAGTAVAAALVASPEGIWRQLSDLRIRKQLSHPRILVHGIQPVTVLARGESMRDVDTRIRPTCPWFWGRTMP